MVNSKIVAEIEKCYNECLKRAKVIDSDYWIAKADAYRNVLVILDDTIEVKELDLESLLHPSKVNNNLFKEVYYGKPYKTRDGRKALYCYKFADNSHALIIEGEEEFWYVRDDGLVDDFDNSFMDSSYYTDKDIISEW